MLSSDFERVVSCYLCVPRQEADMCLSRTQVLTCFVYLSCEGALSIVLNVLSCWALYCKVW